jgi:hypothetical protein
MRARAKSQDDSSWRIVNSKVVDVYRDGKEVIDPREWGKHSHPPEGEGLITRGTFGPILLTVIVDAHGEMTWERGSAGMLAVIRHSVPANQSHYSVAFHGLSSDKGDAEPITGCYGKVAIDPATGTILRLTVQAEQPFGLSRSPRRHHGGVWPGRNRRQDLYLPSNECLDFNGRYEIHGRNRPIRRIRSKPEGHPVK